MVRWVSQHQCSWSLFSSTVACWVISNEYKNPHGRIFKSWYVPGSYNRCFALTCRGRKVMRARPDIEVTVRQ